MSNRDTEAARAYHEATKLSYINLNNKPPLYKSYSGLPVIPLPQSDLGSTVPAPDALTSPMAVAGPSLDHSRCWMIQRPFSHRKLAVSKNDTRDVSRRPRKGGSLRGPPSGRRSPPQGLR